MVASLHAKAHPIMPAFRPPTTENERESRRSHLTSLRAKLAIPAPKPVTVDVRKFVLEDPARIIPERSRRSPIFVFTDHTVHSLYGEEFVRRLRSLDYSVHSIVMRDGEISKSLANYHDLTDKILKLGVDELSVFISLGGGVVCNVCGFVASTIYRGMQLIQVPTTLMAQCDAAISHKQGINGYHGKNLIGSYYPPSHIEVDPTLLSSLPERRIRDGLAEVVKHALGQDADYFDFLLSHRRPLHDADFLEAVVKRNIELKAQLAAEDPKEHAHGMVLQYGHTIGHAIEHLSEYALFHGEAVAIGMVAAAHVSCLLGVGDADLVAKHKEVLAWAGLPSAIPESMDAAAIVSSLRYAKRFANGKPHMALLSSVGQLHQRGGEYAIPVSNQVILEAIARTRT